MAVDLELDLQLATVESDVPTRSEFARWTVAVLEGRRARAGLTIRVVDAAEGRDLNRRFRSLDKPTNVLSFPFEVPPVLAGIAGLDEVLGDLVICAPVVQAEAREQGKDASAHWAHLVVHGVLHLLDYDHLTDEEAVVMENLETTLLVGLGFPPPYEDAPATQ